MGSLARMKKTILSFFHLPPGPKWRERKSYSKSLKQAMGHINSIRRKHGLKPIPIDDRALALARARLYDLHKYHYFAHINPRTKSDIDTMKTSFGFNSHEGATENLYGGGRSDDMHAAIIAWMKSDGHRSNLLFTPYTGGAVAAYRGNVVFIGVVDFRHCPRPAEW